MVTIDSYIEALRTIAKYKQQLDKPFIIIRYLKMALPSMGKFSNSNYDIIGIMWLGRLIGKCTRSKYKNVINVGDCMNLPQYHLRTDMIPQFLKS